MKSYNGADSVKLSARTITPEGYLVANGVIARTGIQEYYAYEFGFGAGDGYKSDSVIRLYRPPEEVFAPDSLRSFEGVPITIDHPKQGVTVDNWKELAKGDANNVVKVGDALVGATLTIRDKAAIDTIQTGKTQLSNGYRFDMDLTPGTTPEGLAYDGKQLNIRGNHLAIVDKARCGSVCSILDNQPEPIPIGGHMADLLLRKMVVDGIPVEVTDATAAVIEKLQKALDSKEVGLSTANATIKKLIDDGKVALDAKDKEIADLKKLVMTPEARDAMVAEWSELIANAKKFVPEIVVTGKDCETIRREVLTHVAGGTDHAANVVKAIVKDAAVATGEVLKLAFDAVQSLAPAQQQPATSTNDGASFVSQTPVTHAVVGRDKFMKATQDAWMPKTEGVK